MGTTQKTFSLIRRIAAGVILAVAPVVIMYGLHDSDSADQAAANLHITHGIVINGYWVPR